MKIAQVTPYEYPYPGGVTEHVMHLDERLRGMGQDVRIIAPQGKDELQVQENLITVSRSIVQVPFAGSNARLSLSPNVYRTVKRLLKQEQFDVVHVHEPLTPFLCLSVLRHSKTINVGTFHAYREEASPTLERLSPVFKPLVDRLHVRICVSEAAYEHISRYYPGDYTIIPNGIDYHEFAGPQVQPLDGLSDGRPTLLFVGRLEARKGFEHLLRAYPYVLQEFPEARLLVVGAYDKEDKEPYVRDARLQHLTGIRFVGRVSSEELPRYYRSCSVFCAPSTGFESFGIVLLEAMAAGKPIVASSIAGYRSIMDDGREGYLVPPADEHALADAIIRILKNPSVARQMGEQGRRKAALYDWSIIAGRVLDIYERLMQQKAQGLIHVE
jgi:phosphatidyl-myo-inositol alpha-mannosyltransferase